jgi:HK97 family phage portal protein
MFNGIDEGLLARAGRTIKTAIDLEKAAQRMANEPAPSMVLKNSGVDLPENQVTSLLNNWKSARQNRATAYLGGNINVEAFGFDAMQMQLVEARRHLSTEIARAVGIPAWYLNAEYASETYSNVQQERRTLIDFSLRPILHAIEERLSMDDITPRNQEVRFDLDDYMRGNPMDMADYVEKLLNLQLIDIPQAQEMLEILPSKEQA